MASSRRSLPPSRWGPALLLSLGDHEVHSSGSVRGFGWSSWLSTLPASWFRFLQLSQFPVVLAWGFHCLHFRPNARPLFVPLAVPPHLASCLVGFTSPRLSSSLFPRRLARPGLRFPGSRGGGAFLPCLCSLFGVLVLPSGALRCRRLLSTRWLPLMSFSWRVSRPSSRCCCSLFFCRPSRPSSRCCCSLFFCRPSRPSSRCCCSLFFCRPSCPSVSFLCWSEAIFWEPCPL